MLHPPALHLFRLLLVLAIGGDDGSDFTVLEIPCTGCDVCGNKPTVSTACIQSGLSEVEGPITTCSRIVTVMDSIAAGSPTVTDVVRHQSQM